MHSDRLRLVFSVRITVHLCFEFFAFIRIYVSTPSSRCSKSYAHTPLENGNRKYLDAQVTIRGPFLLAPALHVDHVSSRRFPGFPGHSLWLCVGKKVVP